MFAEHTEKSALIRKNPRTPRLSGISMAIAKSAERPCTARKRAGSPHKARRRGLREAAQAAFVRVARPCTGQAEDFTYALSESRPSLTAPLRAGIIHRYLRRSWKRHR